MGRKHHNNDRDFELLQKLKHENRILKKQLASLRKTIDRLDLENYRNLQELVHKQSKEDIEIDKMQKNNSVSEKWKCHKCQEDYLRTFILQRRDGNFYYRRCPSCSNRTKLKKYTSEIESVE